MPLCHLGLQFRTKPSSFKRPWGSDSNLSCTVMSLLKEPLWCLQAQQKVLGNTTSLVKIMATSQTPDVEAGRPCWICFSKKYDWAQTGFILSKDCFFNPELGVENMSWGIFNGSETFWASHTLSLQHLWARSALGASQSDAWWHRVPPEQGALS